MTTPETEAPAFEKEVVRLPDGRELTYYRFPEAPVSREPAGERSGPKAGAGERGPGRMGLGRGEQGGRGSRASPSEAPGRRGPPMERER